MNKNLLTLNELPTGSVGKVKELIADGSTRRRMLDLGLIHDTYEIRGAVIALRLEEATQILVELI